MTWYGKQLWALLFLAVVVALTFQGTRGLYETSEGRYAECAREMLESGNYLEPTLGYRPHWTKPPLTYWSMVAGMKLLGENAWGVRLYNSVAFVLTVLTVAALGNALFGSGTGILAGLIYATSPFPVFAAWAATTDTLLTFWATVAVLCFVMSWKSAAQPRSTRGWSHAMWACFGIAFAVKGPPALLPLLPIVVWNRRQAPRAPLWSLPGLVLFAALGFSWYLVVCARHPGLMTYFMTREIAGRVVSTTVHHHAWYKGVPVYFPVLAVGAGLWMIPAAKILFAGRFRWFSQARPFFKSNPRHALLALWALLPLCFLMISSSKLQLYVLPLSAPISILLACTMGESTHNRGGSRRQWLLALAMAVILIGIKGGISKQDAQYLTRIFRARGIEFSQDGNANWAVLIVRKAGSQNDLPDPAPTGDPVRGTARPEPLQNGDA